MSLTGPWSCAIVPPVMATGASNGMWFCNRPTRWIVIVRREDGWLSEIVSGTGASLDLPEIGVSVPLQEVYANAGLADEGEEGGR